MRAIPGSLMLRLTRLVVGDQSLHKQLLLWLVLPQLVLWMAAAFVTYNVAARYANRAIDASLLQATRALARQVKPIGNGLFIDFPRAAQDIIEADPDDRVYYMVSTPPGQFILGSKKLPPPALIGPPRLGEPYFYDGLIDDRMPIRVAALYVAYGDSKTRQLMLVQIARGRARRDELARSILGDTVLPLSGLILLMTMIVWAGIRAGLAPLARMRALVEDRAPNDLAPLRIDDSPQELRSLSRALNDLLAAVHESVAAQRRFVNDAAHQLRTPLAGLKSQTELALGENVDPAQQQRLERVHESAVRSAHLVNQLLSLARAEPESALAQHSSRVDLRELAREVTAEWVPKALQAAIDLGLDEAGDDAPPVTVQGHPLLIREALQNLIDNAIRYAGASSEVTVGVRREGSYGIVQVTDTGPGIPPDLHRAVFERFVRATHEGSGCGLGLAIVKSIAERHAGQVTLSGMTPHGLQVRIALPLAR
ncbi:sensor histidine kinase [Scleromatobacter humisilvae]|uniref:histidine kinase n=1 Tax=Scleromatobacter humisilvae TaxID=2897159 RepID=A0A9X2C2A7_9BURK|nr:sensor histidine kinase [Scleromatobacter humisilvae]MCK9689087.1 sensor histidine kinase [Scleromatobacter humisilvae]